MKCPVCSAEILGEMFDHLYNTHPRDDWGAHSRNGHLYTINGQVAVGTTRRTAYALAVFPLDIVARETIRAMLPEGTRRGGSKGSATNRVSGKFGDALRSFEQREWIVRGRKYLKVINRGELLDLACRDIDPRERVEFIRIHDAVNIVRRQIEEADHAKEREQAVRELQAIYDLMKSDTNQGANRGGRGTVRHVPHGWRGRPS